MHGAAQTTLKAGEFVTLKEQQAALAVQQDIFDHKTGGLLAQIAASQSEIDHAKSEEMLAWQGKRSSDLLLQEENIAHQWTV